MMAAQRERSVYIQKKPQVARAVVLAPFLRQFRGDAVFQALPKAAWPIVFMAMAARDGSFVFVRNPKAGCTSVAHRAYMWLSGSAFHGEIHRDTEVLRHGYPCSAEVIRAMTSGVPIFSFVRHPENRACSAFTNLLENGRNISIARHLPFLERMGYRPDNDRARNFDIFLDYVAQSLETDAAWTDPHFRPQVLNLREDVLPYSFVGRVERLDEDLRKLEAMLGVSAPRHLETAERHNRTDNPYVPTSAQRLRIRDLYGMDFEAYGY